MIAKAAINCKEFDEVGLNYKKNIGIKTPLRNEMGIPTLKNNENHQIQYFMGSELDIYQFMGIHNDEIPKETKH